MTDRRNRAWLTLIGVVLFAGGALSALLGAGAFGEARAQRDVFDTTLIRWWNEGGWESFAVVTAIGAVAVIIGVGLIRPQLYRNDGRSRTHDVTFPPNGAPGETTLRASAVSHNLQTDLVAIPNVTRALVGLFGEYPAIEMRAVLTVSDHIDLDTLPARVDDALERVKRTVGARPEPVEVTLRFKTAEKQRQLS